MIGTGLSTFIGRESIFGLLRDAVDLVLAVLVVREPMAKLLVVDPVLPQGEVEHAERGVASDEVAEVEKGRQTVLDLVGADGGIRLEEHQTLKYISYYYWHYLRSCYFFGIGALFRGKGGPSGIRKTGSASSTPSAGFVRPPVKLQSYSSK